VSSPAPVREAGLPRLLLLQVLDATIDRVKGLLEVLRLLSQGFPLLFGARSREGAGGGSRPERQTGGVVPITPTPAASTATTSTPAPESSAANGVCMTGNRIPGAETRRSTCHRPHPSGTCSIATWHNPPLSLKKSASCQRAAARRTAHLIARLAHPVRHPISTTRTDTLAAGTGGRRTTHTSFALASSQATSCSRSPSHGTRSISSGHDMIPSVNLVITTEPRNGLVGHVRDPNPNRTPSQIAPARNPGPTRAGGNHMELLQTLPPAAWRPSEPDGRIRAAGTPPDDRRQAGTRTVRHCFQTA